MTPYWHVAGVVEKSQNHNLVARTTPVSSNVFLFSPAEVRDTKKHS
jgi:hypothetical protein